MYCVMKRCGCTIVLLSRATFSHAVGWTSAPHFVVRAFECFLLHRKRSFKLSSCSLTLKKLYLTYFLKTLFFVPLHTLDYPPLPISPRNVLTNPHPHHSVSHHSEPIIPLPINSGCLSASCAITPNSNPTPKENPPNLKNPTV